MQESSMPRAVIRFGLLLFSFCLFFLFEISSDHAVVSARTARPNRAPLLDANAPDQVPGQYIVVFKPNLSAPEMQRATDRVAKNLRGTVVYEYRAALNGFAARLDKKALKQLRLDPTVEFVEQDKRVSINDGFESPHAPSALDTSQTNATWGLDRIDQRNLPLDNVYSYTPDGTGVNVYVIDTGIRSAHTEFGGRAFAGYDSVKDGYGTFDCNGHGTHVSGTIGSSTYGVAKKVNLYAVRVLDCDGFGTDSGVIAGIDWVTAQRVKPAIANMSLGGSKSNALDNATRNSIKAGVVFTIAAGNENQNACNTSPAGTAEAITVGATTSADKRSSFSNYGACLDLFAPGSSITSLWNSSNTALNTISGTSMASPHVAGVAALYLQEHPTASPQTVRDAIVNNATPNKVTSLGSGSPNFLLYSIWSAAPPTNTPTPTQTPPPGTTPTPVAPRKNVLKNGGFEKAPTLGWSQASNLGEQIVDTAKAHKGKHSAHFCNRNRCTEWIEQSLVVPTNSTLTYWWYQTSSEGTSSAYDFLRVQAFDQGGSLIATLRTRSNKHTRGKWSQDSISLAAYGGQTLKLRFTVTTDGNLKTGYFVDDIAVK